MAKLWAPLHGAWKVLTFGALTALPVVLAKSAAVAQSTLLACLVVLTKAGAVAHSTRRAFLVMLAEPGSATRSTQMSILVMYAKCGTVALPTLLALFVVLAKGFATTGSASIGHPPMCTSLHSARLLPNAPFHRVWCWRHFYN